LSRTQSQILPNSSILKTHPNQSAVTTCNEKVVSHCQNNKVMVDHEKEITSKDNSPNSPINSNTNKYYNVSPIPQSLENSIPNEISTLPKETQNDESYMNLLHSDFDLDMEDWSNFLLDDAFSDDAPPSTHF